jgi:hypothetical protein
MATVRGTWHNWVLCDNVLTPAVTQTFPRIELSALYNQVPQDKHGAQSRSSKESVACRAGSARALLELFVPLADALGCLKRVGNQLVNVRRLCGEVADEQVLELGNLDE